MKLKITAFFLMGKKTNRIYICYFELFYKYRDTNLQIMMIMAMILMLMTIVVVLNMEKKSGIEYHYTK